MFQSALLRSYYANARSLCPSPTALASSSCHRHVVSFDSLTTQPAVSFSRAYFIFPFLSAHLPKPPHPTIPPPTPHPLHTFIQEKNQSSTYLQNLQLPIRLLKQAAQFPFIPHPLVFPERIFRPPLRILTEIVGGELGGRAKEGAVLFAIKISYQCAIQCSAVHIVAGRQIMKVN